MRVNSEKKRRFPLFDVKLETVNSMALEFDSGLVVRYEMPGMDGYELARRLRQEPGLEGPLLVALTSYGQEEDRRRSREASIDHHLVKPVDPEALEALLAGPQPSAK
jgi:CheY-like chemotaxis protein